MFAKLWLNTPKNNKLLQLQLTIQKSVNPMPFVIENGNKSLQHSKTKSITNVRFLVESVTIELFLGATLKKD